MQCTGGRGSFFIFLILITFLLTSSCKQNLNGGIYEGTLFRNQNPTSLNEQIRIELINLNKNHSALEIQDLRKVQLERIELNWSNHHHHLQVNLASMNGQPFTLRPIKVKKTNYWKCYQGTNQRNPNPSNIKQANLNQTKMTL